HRKLCEIFKARGHTISSLQIFSCRAAWPVSSLPGSCAEIILRFLYCSRQVTASGRRKLFSRVSLFSKSHTICKPCPTLFASCGQPEFDPGLAEPRGRAGRHPG